MKKLLAIIFLSPFVISENINIKEVQTNDLDSLMFVGNSFFYYNNGVHKPTLGMVKANKDLGKGHRFRNITINSSSLEWHDVESYVTNQKIGSFSITSKNKYKKYDPENYQLAILMDCSQCPIHPDRKDLFHFYVDEHSKTLKKYEKAFAKEIIELSASQRKTVLAKSKVATQVLASYNKSI